jgi:tRNA-uridine 2-sulfurtransferase
MKYITAVALSGGIDSAAAAYILKQNLKKDASLIGVSHIIWPESRCCNETAMSRAETLCSKLGISFLKFDLLEGFKEKIINNFIDNYISGRTPNPCVLCNELVRFSLFIEEIKKFLKLKLKADFDLKFSTGHYVRIKKIKDRLFLRKAKDILKDQSYMLYRLPAKLLGKLIFPLGEYFKADIVKMASDWGLGMAEVRESQDACFVEDDYVSFIIENTGKKGLLEEGEISDREGNLLGKHRGYINYTIGQRRGLGLGNGPWYVCEIKPENNRIIVARESEINSESFIVNNINWFTDKTQTECGVKVRYQSGEIPCVINFSEDGNQIEVQLKKPAVVTPGQSAVFYDKDIVLGGGIIVKN